MDIYIENTRHADMGNNTNSMEISKLCHQMDYIIYKEIVIFVFAII